MNAASNVAVISESMLIAASHVVSGSDFDLRLFFDFSSLVDAAVLHEELLVIPGRLSGQNEDMPFRSQLFDAEICRHFKVTDETAVAHSAAYILSLRRIPWHDHGWTGLEDSDPRDWEGNRKDAVDALDFINRLPSDIESVRNAPEKLIEREDPAVKTGAYRSRLGDFVGWGLHQLEDHLKQGRTRIDDLDLLDFVHTSRTGPGCGVRQYLMRTAAYYALSQEELVTYYPDFRRIPMLLSMHNRLQAGITRQLYDRIANALQVEISELIDDGAPFQFAIPPLTAMLLDSCSSKEDIPCALFDLRRQFSDYRASLGEYTDRIRNASSIQEARDAKRRLSAILKAHLGRLEQKDGSILLRGLGLVNDAARIIEKPANPTSYSVALLSKPVEWLRNWWLHRPLNVLFSMEKKVTQIEQYQALIEKVFGVDYRSQQFEEFRQYAAQLQRYLYPSDDSQYNPV